MTKILYSLLLIYVSLLVIIYIFQRAFLYMPTPAYSHNYQQITVQSSDANIEVIVLNEGKDKALMYFGGNAEPVLANAQDFSEQFTEHTVYLVNYRAYGGSSGKPSETALTADAKAVFDHIDLAHKSIAVMGRSLGSGVAMYLGAHREVSHIVLITPYDSIEAIAKKQFPIFPVSLLLKDKFDSLSLANSISAPVLLIAGAADTLIPFEHTERLAQALGRENAELVIIENAGHNDIQSFSDFYANIKDFLQLG